MTRKTLVPVIVPEAAPPPSPVPEFLSVFLLAIRDVIPTLLHYDDARLVKKIGKERAEEAGMDLAGLMDSGVSSPLTRNERVALAHKLMQCLVNVIQREMKLPVTVKTVVDRISLLPYAIEQSFPGYAQSKLLKYCIIVPTRSRPELVDHAV